jgi:glucose-1-phosphate cytidylyltransferase
VDTGDDTNTGGRIRRIARYLRPEEPFCLTYGDGLSDIDITALIAFHNTHGLKATLTATQPPGRFGVLDLDGSKVRSFKEKPQGEGALINGGFFVLHPSVLDFIAGDSTIWERGPLDELASQGQLLAFRHDGFWQPMDTLRDKTQLEGLWASGQAPWKVWK